MYDIKVSVIIPVYNAEKYISECVESLLCQTHTLLEIIIVNDGSSDGSLNVCRSLAQGDSRIIVIDKENGGPTSCRRAGFEAASGKYIYFSDADDLVEKDAIETMLALCEENNSEIAACGYEKFGEVSGRFPVKSENSIITKNEFTEKIVLPAVAAKAEDSTYIPSFLWNHLYLSSCVTPECFVSDKICTREDTCFNLNVLKNVSRVSVTGKILYRYRINSGSITNAYRKNRLQRDLEYIKFIRTYLASEGIECEDRVRVMISGIFFGNINNFAKAGTAADFRAGMLEIKNSGETDGAVRSGELTASGLVQKLTVILYRSNMFRLLYMMRKAVLKIRG